MFRKLLLATMLLVLLTATLQARTKLYYLEFNTATYEALEKRLATLELAGVRAAHIFPPNAVIAEVPTGSFGVMEKGAGITTCRTEKKCSGECTKWRYYTSVSAEEFGAGCEVFLCGYARR
ncbi:MAG: hypothetical protein NT028_09660 [candidate division Zixibacteria bacterium]|nr:hypothetical protein [candidate division Zixibacteria bacterium]